LEVIDISLADVQFARTLIDLSDPARDTAFGADLFASRFFLLRVFHGFAFAVRFADATFEAAIAISSRRFLVRDAALASPPSLPVRRFSRFIARVMRFLIRPSFPPC
jgi:hypothetical protein